MKENLLGKMCRDTVSGWKGVAIGRYEYMNGCVRYDLAAADKEGKPTSFVFDEEQVESLAPELHPAMTAPQSGGPRGTEAPPRR